MSTYEELTITVIFAFLFDIEQLCEYNQHVRIPAVFFVVTVLNPRL